MKNYKVKRVMRSSGANGYPSVWYRYQIHANGEPLLTKAGKERSWASYDAAWKALCKIVSADNA